MRSVRKNFYEHIALLKKEYVLLEIEEFTGLFLKQKKNSQEFSSHYI